MSFASVASRALRWILATLLAAGLLAWLLHDAPWRSLLTQALTLPGWAWIVVAAGLTGTYVLRALRLRFEWAHRETVGLAECLRIVLAHNLALMLMPLRAGEGSYVWLVSRRWRVSLVDAAASLLWLRLQDAYVLALLAVAILPPWPAPARIALAFSLLLVGSTLIPTLVRLGRRRSKWVQRFAKVLLAHRGDSTGWVCSCANWSLKLGVIGLLFAALAGVEPATALRAAVGGELAGALPLQAPAGLGTYELGAWIGSGLSGLAGQRLLAAAVLIHAVGLAWTVVLAALAQAARPASAPPGMATA